MKKTFRKVLALLLTVIMIVTALPMTASALTYGALTYTVSNGEVTITDCNTSATEVIIPDTIEGYPVTTIGDSAFYNCRRLASVTIGNSVTTIGSYAFYDCRSLASIDIPDSVTTIGSCAFSYCYSLASIEIPDSVTAIFDSAFEDCDSLASIDIPDSVTTICNYAFIDCDSLASIDIPDSVTTIGEMAFFSCGGLASVTIGNSVTTIGWSAFEDCDSLASIDIPDSVTTIGDSAFIDCDSLESIDIPDSVTTIDDFAFYSCDNLASVTINNPDCDIYDTEYTIDSRATIYGYKGSTAQAYAEKYNRKFVVLEPDRTEEILNALSYEIIDGEVTITDCDESFAGEMIIPDTIDGYPVTKIADYAFCYCSQITSLTIPDNTTTIGDFAFSDCDSINEIKIGKNLNEIGYRAFCDCDNLEFITVDESNEYFSHDEYGVLFNKDKTELIQYPDNNNRTKYTIPVSVTSVRDYAFYFCNQLNYITIPYSVNSIGECSLLSINIKNITVDSNNKNYSNDENGVLFNKDKSVLIQYPVGNERTEYTIPDGVITIGDDSFSYCCNLESVTISDSVKSIGNNAFYDCNSVTKLTIGQNVESIGFCAISDCDRLEEVILGDSVTSIDDFAFSFCNSLTKITINNPDCDIYDTEDTIDSRATIYGYEGSTAQAYAEKYNREFVALEPDRTEEILNALFYEIIDGEVTITACDNSFAGEMIIPETIEGYPVTTIGDGAFSFCGRIASIDIPDSVTTIGDSAFAFCDSLASIDIPDSVTTIGMYAFYYCYSLASIDIPDSVTTIGDQAFYYCNSLASIKIPDSVTTIGDSAFFLCDSLESITVDENNTSYSSDEYGVLFNKHKTELIQYPTGNSRTGYTIPDSVTTIGKSAFYDCDSLASIDIPDSVTTIGSCAFYHCDSLASIEIPDSVTTIGDSAFFDCDSLASVTINNPDCDIYDSHDTIDSRATIYGYEGSTAQAYAEKYDREFVALELPDTTISLAKVTGRPGETVTVNVAFDTETAVKSMLIYDFVYDTEKLTLVNGKWLDDTAIISDWNQNDSAGAITFKENKKLSGNIFELTFRINDNLEDSQVEINCDARIKALDEYNVENPLTVGINPGMITITNIIKGDVNGDNFVDSNDAILLLYHTLLPERYEVNQHCDFNADNFIDSNDAILLLYHTLLPERYPLA